MPSRLIGEEVQIRLYADWVEVYYKDHLIERTERVRGEREANVNYRHVIGSLMRKPGAFARYASGSSFSPPCNSACLRRAPGMARERADVEHVRILHLAAITMEGHGGQRFGAAPGDGPALRLRRGAGPGRAQAARGPGAHPVRPAGPEGLWLAAGGGGLVTDTAAVQERSGELCHQFKLPTMGAQSVSRFTAAGHGDALATFLEVLEEGAEDRRHRRISRLRKESRLPSGKTWETFDQ